MTDYPYEPPERMLSDTLLAFRDFELASTWGVRVENDWLGDVNQIVSLMHVGKRIREPLICNESNGGSHCQRSQPITHG